MIIDKHNHLMSKWFNKTTQRSVCVCMGMRVLVCVFRLISYTSNNTYELTIINNNLAKRCTLNDCGRQSSKEEMNVSENHIMPTRELYNA